MARDGSTIPGPATFGADASEDSESSDWSPPKPESSSKTRDCDGGGGGSGRLILPADVVRDFLPPEPEAEPEKAKGNGGSKLLSSEKCEM